MAIEEPFKEFRCTSASFYFLYSFVFDKININEGNEIIKKALEDGGYSPNFPQEKGNFVPYLKINEQFIEFDFFPEAKRANIIKENRSGKIGLIEKNILIHRTGTGVYTIKITFNESLKIEELIDFALLGEEETYQIKYTESTNAKPLFELFSEDMKLITESWESEKKEKIWFEKNQGLVNPNVRYQTPFVCTELELPDDIYKEAVITSAGYKKEIAAILFRVKEEDDWKYIDESYLSKYEDTYDTKLANMHLHTKLFVSFHTRSCISIFSNKKVAPAIYFLPALLDTIQLLRCRWHSYVIYNKYLDDMLRQLYDDYINEKSNITQLLESIISIREDLSSSLEDPITWRRASGSLGGVYEEGLKRFRIESLERLMIEKMDMLDRLFENIKEYGLRQNIEQINKQKKKWSGMIWLFISFLLFLLGVWFILKKVILLGFLILGLGTLLFILWSIKREHSEEKKFQK